ncbi:hypothetical protein ANANG_G00166390 [Anguilla anguilla]|uniref:BHLH domain-containing protein n=1 Tax=Anguilla anguilla TaxID=7936 RepID=A0A9D3RVN7_ANGAN|nr:hypothetical protein ANANG_G00166390 [Anguilla anguilla]
MEVIMKSSGANLKVDLKTTRKLLKPQVEKRRRERMNRSLESLRALLLQGSQHQALASRRVEKAEVLEHTVLFLQSAAHRGAAEGSQQQDFQDGFSTCLQRAARFLRDSRAGRRGGGAERHPVPSPDAPRPAPQSSHQPPLCPHAAQGAERPAGGEELALQPAAWSRPQEQPLPPAQSGPGTQTPQPAPAPPQRGSVTPHKQPVTMETLVLKPASR